MKVLLAILSLMAIVRPEHFVPVVLTGAVVLGLLILIGKAFKRFEDGAQTAAKILLAALAVVAIVRPEHFVPVVLAGAVAVGLLVLIGLSVRLFKGAGRFRPALPPTDPQRHTGSD